MLYIHTRFRIEDVNEELSPSSQHAPSSSTLTGGVAGDQQPSSPPRHDTTITSFGYNTAEAVPMTMYYRNEEEEGGRSKTRPTLDYLRERSGSNLPGLVATVRDVTMYCIVHIKNVKSCLWWDLNPSYLAL